MPSGYSARTDSSRCSWTFSPHTVTRTGTPATYRLPPAASPADAELRGVDLARAAVGSALRRAGAVEFRQAAPRPLLEQSLPGHRTRRPRGRGHRQRGVQAGPEQARLGVRAGQVGPRIGGAEQIAGAGRVDHGSAEVIARYVDRLSVAERERPAGAERHDHHLGARRQALGRLTRRRAGGQHERLPLVDEQRPRAALRGGWTARVGAGVVVAAGHVDGRAVRHDADLVQADRDRPRLEGGQLAGVRPHARVVGDERALALEREHDGRRRPRAAARQDLHALALERGAHQVAGHVLAERRRQHGAQAEARGADGRDRAAAGRPHEISGEALLAGPRQPLESDERQVEERRRGDGQVDRHAKRSWSSGSRARYPAKISRAVLTEGTSGCSTSASTASSLEPVRAAWIVALSTALTVSISARAWSGTSPAASGRGPERSTSAGTSTTARASRNGRAEELAALTISSARAFVAIASTTAIASTS